MDSISARGMTNPLRDASVLSAAVAAGLDGSRPLAGALRDHHRDRDRAIRGMYDFTLGTAARVLGSRAILRLSAAPGEPPAPRTTARDSASGAGA